MLWTWFFLVGRKQRSSALENTLVRCLRNHHHVETRLEFVTPCSRDGVFIFRAACLYVPYIFMPQGNPPLFKRLSLPWLLHVQEAV